MLRQRIKIYLQRLGIVFSVLLAMLVFVQPVFAANGGGAQDSGGGVANGCDSGKGPTWGQDKWWACEYAGAGWTRYEYTDPNFKDKLYFMPSHAGTGEHPYAISAKCTEYGGFWHYGYNMIKKGYTQTYGGITTYANGYTSTGNPAWNEAVSNTANRDKNIGKINSSNLNHYFTNSSGKTIAKAVAVGRDGKNGPVYQAYQKFLEYSGEQNLWGKGLNYFCANASNTPPNKQNQGDKTYITPKMTLWVKDPSASHGSLYHSDDTVESKKDSVDLWFYHYFDRDDRGTKTATGKWWIKGNWLPDNASWPNPSNGWTEYSINRASTGASAQQRLNEGSRTSPYMQDYRNVWTPPGYDRVLYQDLWGTNWADAQSGKAAPTGYGRKNYVKAQNVKCTLTGYDGYDANEQDGRGCLRLHRNPANFYASSNLVARAGGQSLTNPTTEVIELDEESRYDLEFRFELNRKDDNDAGGTATTNFRILDEDNKEVSSGSKTLANNKGDVITFVEHGVIYPGESRKICRTMEYDSKIDWKHGNAKTRTTERCVTIRRKKGECWIDGRKFEYDIYNGTNRGGITVENVTTHAVDAAYNIGIGSPKNATVWAAPGDHIRFKHEICAAGQANADYWNGKNPSTYRIGAMVGDDLTAAIDINNGTYRKFRFGTRLNSGSSTATDTFYYGGDGAADGVYEDLIWSPTKGNDRYYCRQPVVPGFFEIPAEKNKNDCASSREVEYASNVGTFITQYMNFSRWNVVNGVPTTTNPLDYQIKANVQVPYNYNVGLTMRKPETLPVQAGQNLNVSYDIDIQPRCNMQVRPGCDKDPTKNYATISKRTMHRVIMWQPDVGTPAAQVADQLGDPIMRNGKVDGYYIVKDPSKIRGVTTLSKSDKAQAKRYEGNTKSLLGEKDINFRIPDNAPTGAKYCFAAAVWPSDSHHNPEKQVIDHNMQTYAFEIGEVFNYWPNLPWRVSTPTCYTVSRKAHTVIGGGEAYAENGFKGFSEYRKLNNVAYNFGSWSEYGLKSKAVSRIDPVTGQPKLTNAGSIVDFASGASLAGGDASSSRDPCRYSPLSYGNVTCKSEKKVGRVSRDVDDKRAIEDLAQNIKARYYATEDSKGNPIVDLGGPSGVDNTVYLDGACYYEASSGLYTPAGGSGYSCLKDGTKYAYSSGNLGIGATTSDVTSSIYLPYLPEGTGSRSRTVVVRAKNVEIRQNIIYGQPRDLDTRNSSSNHALSSTSQIPQMIIIADDTVDILGNVSRVDAWIIAKHVNTCKTRGKIHGSVCSLELTINGPVIARYFDLFRMHGGGPGSHEFNNFYDWNKQIYNTADRHILASPGEIFNVGVETYLWSLSDGGSGSQAKTVYQREIAPRY